MKSGNFSIKGTGGAGSQFAICICEMQKLCVFSSRDEAKAAWWATVWILFGSNDHQNHFFY